MKTDNITYIILFTLIPTLAPALLVFSGKNPKSFQYNFIYLFVTILVNVLIILAGYYYYKLFCTDVDHKDESKNFDKTSNIFKRIIEPGFDTLFLTIILINVELVLKYISSFLNPKSILRKIVNIFFGTYISLMITIFTSVFLTLFLVEHQTTCNYSNVQIVINPNSNQSEGFICPPNTQKANIIQKLDDNKAMLQTLKINYRKKQQPFLNVKTKLPSNKDYKLNDSLCVPIDEVIRLSAT